MSANALIYLGESLIIVGFGLVVVGLVLLFIDSEDAEGQGKLEQYLRKLQKFSSAICILGLVLFVIGVSLYDRGYNKNLTKYLQVAKGFISRVDRVDRVDKEIREKSLDELDHCLKKTDLLSSSFCYDKAVSRCENLKDSYQEKLKRLCILYLTDKGIEWEYAEDACSIAVNSYLNKVDCSKLQKAYLKQIDELLNKQK